MKHGKFLGYFAGIFIPDKVEESKIDIPGGCSFLNVLQRRDSASCAMFKD
jgi:hypothetical protein